MNHGFTSQHFALLAEWQGVSRNKNDPANNSAYEALREPHDATAKWARLLQSKHFPRGRWEMVRRPTFQSNNFKPYTWARIYPTTGSPEELAYTVGIDAVGEFCVKIDTVNAGRNLRKRYEELRGPDYRASALVSVIPADEGLALSLDRLVEWSAQEISRFGRSYREVAETLGLVSPFLQLVTDSELSRQSFNQWESCLLEGAEKHNSMWWLRDRGVFFRRHNATNNIGLELGLDPRGETWAVQINEPAIAGDYNPLSSIAVDKKTGARFVLRQGRLQPNARRATYVKGQDFIRLTGLQPVTIESGPAADRDWFLVAALDEPNAAVRRRTASFVERCWAPYIPAGSQSGKSFPSTVMDGKAETGGTYVIPAKQAIDEKLVIRRHGAVWLELTSVLSEFGINYWKGQIDSGFEIDLEIVRPDDVPLLIEIKTDTSTSSIYTGLGQLQLYRRLFPRLKDHQPVLLLPTGVRPELKKAILDCGVALQFYRLSEDGVNTGVEFTSEFLALCMAAPKCHATA